MIMMMAILKHTDEQEVCITRFATLALEGTPLYSQGTSGYVTNHAMFLTHFSS